MSTITPPITSVEATVAPRTREASVEVRPLVAPAERAGWGRYVDAAVQASLYHHPRWSDAVVATFGHRPRHLGAFRGAQLVGVLPLIEVNSLIAGRMLISVPYGNAGGILADNDEACAALTRAACRLADERRARTLDLRSPVANAPGLATIEGYLGFERELPHEPEQVAGMIPKRARAAARHARDRHGVKITHGGQDLRLVWDLYCRSMHRIGSLNYPLAFFQALADAYGEQCWVSVAWFGRRAVCGTITLIDQGCATPYILGADERLNVEGAANYLYQVIMERCVEAGVRRFDYGRSRADNRGPVSFKKNQGFKPVPLGYQRYVPAGRVAPDLKPTNPKFALARRMWPRMPLPLTRAMGVWLSKSLPG